MTTTPKLLLTALALVGVFALSSPSSAQTPPEPLPESVVLWQLPVLGSIGSVAVDEVTGNVFAWDFESRRLLVIGFDGSIVARVEVVTTDSAFRGPLLLTMDAAARRLYACNTTFGGLTVIDIDTYEPTGTYSFDECGYQPMVLDSRRHRMIVVSQDPDAQILTLDLDTLDVKDRFGLPTVDASAFAFDPDGNIVYSSNSPQGFILKTDLATGISTHLVTDLPMGATELLLDTHANLLYAVEYGGGLYVIDLANPAAYETVNNAHLGTPYERLVSFDDSRQHLQVVGSPYFVSMDLRSNEFVTQRFGLPWPQLAAAFDNDRQRLYVLNETHLTAIDAAQLDNPANFPVIGGPPAAPGSSASRWLTLGALLAVIGLLLAQSAVRKHP